MSYWEWERVDFSINISSHGVNLKIGGGPRNFFAPYLFVSRGPSLKWRYKYLRAALIMQNINETLKALSKIISARRRCRGRRDGIRFILQSHRISLQSHNLILFYCLQSHSFPQPSKLSADQLFPKFLLFSKQEWNSKAISLFCSHFAVSTMNQKDKFDSRKKISIDRQMSCELSSSAPVNFWWSVTHFDKADEMTIQGLFCSGPGKLPVPSTHIYQMRLTQSVHALSDCFIKCQDISHQPIAASARLLRFGRQRSIRWLPPFVPKLISVPP
jgi:hypothetical protein